MCPEVTDSLESHDDLDPSRAIELLAPGTRLGDRYEVCSVIGSGGQAVVYLARDARLKRHVALKVLRSDRSSGPFETRFRREARIAGDAEHANLVRIFDIESAGPALYLTMEYVRGESLRARLARGPLPVEEVVGLALQILRGLDALHRLGIVHRDVKPANILIAEDGTAKVADFGLARPLVLTDTKATNTGAVIGTIDYISPEQALGQDIDARADLYSMGVVLFEMLTAVMPFKGESDLGVLLERLKSPAPDVRRLRRDCPRWLARMVARLLAQDREARYGSAREVLDDLQRRRTSLRPPRPVTVRLAAAILLMAVLVAGWAALARSRSFSRLLAAENGVKGVDAGGTVVWSRTDIDPVSVDSSALVRTPQGRRLAIAPKQLSPSAGGTRTHEIRLLDPETGKTLRTIPIVGAEIHFRNVSRRFIPDGMAAVDLDGDGYDEIVVTFIHAWDWPSFAVLVEPGIGRARLVLVASGHHRLAATPDLDGDGQKDLVFVGINNVLGWYNAVAAVRLDPPLNTDAQEPVPACATPDSWYGAASRPLFWYHLLPRGWLQTRPVLRVEKGLLTGRMLDGGEFRVRFDGFSDRTPGDPARAAARQRAYELLRESRRMAQIGDFETARREADRAAEVATTVGEPLLIEALERHRGRLLIASGHETEGEELLARLSSRSPNTSEIAFDAAQALHLRGRLDRAVEWYLRGLSMGARPDQGKNKFDFIEGAVIALVEQGRFDEAAARAAQFMDAFPTASDAGVLFREYARWRGGAVPGGKLPELSWNATDFVRSCQLELRLAAGENPATVAADLDLAAEASSAMRSGLLSLRAEILHRQGRRDEARTVAAQAMSLAEPERGQSLWARAYYPVVKERFDRLTARRE